MMEIQQRKYKTAIMPVETWRKLRHLAYRNYRPIARELERLVDDEIERIGEKAEIKDSKSPTES